MVVVTRRSAAAAAAPPSPSPSPPPRSAARNSTTHAWTHRPSRATLLWLAVSLPLVAWDTAYVLGRPHTMEGGAAHWPLWVPYALYGRVDRVYGWEALRARSGFPAAQAFLNLIESLLYVAYMALCAKGEGKASKRRDAEEERRKKRVNALAVMVGFSAAVMTLSKTILYWMHEYFSGFSNIGHNNAVDLFFLWIVPNGAWLVGSAYMIYSLGRDIFDGLERASTVGKRT